MAVISRPFIIPSELLHDNRFSQNKHTALAFRLLCYTYEKTGQIIYRQDISQELDLPLPTLDRAIRAAKDLGWLSIRQEKVQDEYGKVVGSAPFWDIHIPKGI